MTLKLATVNGKPVDEPQCPATDRLSQAQLDLLTLVKTHMPELFLGARAAAARIEKDADHCDFTWRGHKGVVCLTGSLLQLSFFLDGVQLLNLVWADKDANRFRPVILDQHHDVVCS